MGLIFQTTDVRFPLGSGINGNIGRDKAIATLWMVRFPLGSGINGNMPLKASLHGCPMYASLWEAELMETISIISFSTPSLSYASLWEAELMETIPNVL